MKTIESRQNLEVKGIVGLHERKSRTARGLYLGQGLRVCSTLFKAGQTLKNLYVTYPMLDHARDLLGGESLITVVSQEVMEKISTTDSPSGMVGVFAMPRHDMPKNKQGGVVLARISDPGNMGTLIRSAVCLGQKNVYIIEGADCWSPKVVQASAGTIGGATIIQTSWQELVFSQGSDNLCALVVEGGKKPSDIDLRSMLLVVGNEGHGIPTEWLTDCGIKLTLPMPGNTESLNAAIAGSIALYLAAQSR
jgi:TrmH family RNA methyltransferase